MVQRMEPRASVGPTKAAALGGWIYQPLLLVVLSRGFLKIIQITSRFSETLFCMHVNYNEHPFHR